MEEHSAAQRSLAEVIGTALLVYVGAGSVPAILLLENGSKAPFSGGDLGMIAFAFGLIVTAMIYTVGKVSGCHINPAVTFALAATKRFPWREVPLYWGSQLVGATLGAFAIWATFAGRGTALGYGFGVVNFDHGTVSWGSAFFAEAIGTAILMITVLGIVDSRSPQGWAGLVIGVPRGVPARGHLRSDRRRVRLRPDGDSAQDHPADPRGRQRTRPDHGAGGTGQVERSDR